MTNTIELLETIGRDASLRHAAGPDLAKTLDGMGASEGLKMAAASGDSEHLKPELAPNLNEVVHVNHNPNQTTGGCELDEDADELLDAPLDAPLENGDKRDR